MKSATSEQFYNAINELFDYRNNDVFWQKIYIHFKRNKSVYKAIRYYDGWRDLLNDELVDIYQTKTGITGRNRIENDLKKYDNEVSKKLLGI